MEIEVVSTENAPMAVGPYSQGLKIGQFVFTSGQIALEPKTGELITESVAAQMEQAMKNVKGVLEASGTSLENVLKVTIFIKNMDNYDLINEVYGRFFYKRYPARTCIEVARLPKNAEVEIEAVAAIPD